MKLQWTRAKFPAINVEVDHSSVLGVTRNVLNMYVSGVSCYKYSLIQWKLRSLGWLFFVLFFGWLKWGDDINASSKLYSSIDQTVGNLKKTTSHSKSKFAYVHTFKWESMIIHLKNEHMPTTYIRQTKMNRLKKL